MWVIDGIDVRTESVPGMGKRPHYSPTTGIGEVKPGANIPKENGYPTGKRLRYAEFEASKQFPR